MRVAMPSTWRTMSSIALPACCTAAWPSRRSDTVRSISALISPAAVALRCARLRTSPATTAKPRPCSPARAASTAAFSARMLVWNAMPSIMPMMSTTCCALRCTPSIVCTTRSTVPPPCRAASAALRTVASASTAASAFCRTVALSCSMLAAVRSRLLAWLAVRADRSALPVAISPVLATIASALARTVPTMPDRPWPTPSIARISSPISSRRGLSRRAVRSPAARLRAAVAASASGTLTIRRSIHQNPADTSSASARPAPRKRLRLAISSARRLSTGTEPTISHCHSG